MSENATKSETIREEENLKKLRKILLYMLEIIDKICRENGISYFLDSGTALGAVRHGGFIPWDDDIDIGMMREDYDRFLQIAPQYLPPDLVLQNESNEPAYYFFFSKLRKLNTVLAENRKERDFTNKGIQIDIFPFDYIANDLKTANRRFNYVEKIRIVAEKRLISVPPIPRIKRMIYYMLKLIPAHIYRNAAEKEMRKNNGEKSKYIASYTYMAARYRKCIFPIEAIVPVKDILFEGRTFMIMNDPDCYLRLMYGDYMRLPPEDQRVPIHLNEHLCFDVQNSKE